MTTSGCVHADALGFAGALLLGGVVLTIVVAIAFAIVIWLRRHDLEEGSFKWFGAGFSFKLKRHKPDDSED